MTTNPYQSPQPIAEARSSAPLPLGSILSWTFVFGINLILPVLLGSLLAERHGTQGMAVAVLCLLAVGVGICVWRPRLARQLTLGGVLTALSQLIPILHIALGIFAVYLLHPLGLITDPDEDTPLIASELGGFAMTVFVGAGLLLVAYVLGAGVAWLLPKPKAVARE